MRIPIEFTPLELSFQGNENLKPPGTPQEYTKEMSQEMYKCCMDPIYFIENYYYIVTLDGGLTKIELWDFQRELITTMHDNRFSIVLASRQVGKSVITIGYILWYLLFNSYKYIAVLSKTADAASEIMSKLKIAYQNVPQWLQQNVNGWAATSISLENGSRCSSHATTQNAGRSASANILFLDEFAFVPSNIAQKFYTSAYPIISNSKTSKVIICSTPNGLNHFYIMQDKAKKGENSYKRFVITWDQVPGRDEEWKKMTIANLSMEDGVDGAAKFAQEYDLEFENTNLKSLIGAALQRKIANWISENSKEIQVELLEDIPELTVYEPPAIGELYFLSADVGYGIGKDYSVFNIIKIKNNLYTQVAVYKSNEISPTPFAEIIDRVSKIYGAFILIEYDGPGQSTVDHLWYVLENTNLLNITPAVQGIVKKQKGTKRLGIKQTPKVRNKGIVKLKEFLGFGILVLNDIGTLQEISQFTEINGKFQAEKGFNDDLVLSLIIFCYFTTDKTFLGYLEGTDSENIVQKFKEKIESENSFLMNYDKILNSKEVVITLIDNSQLISNIYD